MSIKKHFLIWVIVIHLLMTAICNFAFRINFILSVYFIACIVLSAVLYVIIWRRLDKSDKVSATCFEMLNEQDFSARLSPVGYPESDRMVDLYNRMIGELREQRLQILDKSEFLNLLIKNDIMGIIILDFDMSITSANPAAEKFLQIPAAQLTGRRLNEFDNVFARALSSLRDNIPQVLEVGDVNRYRCSLLSFLDRGGRHPFITIEELTQELINAEKRASEKVIRTMSHEVNNTLSSIKSNLSLLSGFETCFPEDLRPDIVSALKLSIERSDNLCRFVSAFADVVKLPSPVLAPVYLNDIVKNTVNLMQGVFADAGIKCVMQLADISPLINADSVQIEQALINILKNSIEASVDTKGNVTITTSSGPCKLIISDKGRGISDEIREKVFKPFFTTKPGGQGIGLMLVCEILVNHKFSFKLESREGYTDFRIYM